MNDAELLIAMRLKKQGWHVLFGGWPDLFCSRNGAVRAIEVKGGDDPVMPNQKAMHRALRAAGIRVEVCRVPRCRFRFHPNKSDRKILEALHAKLNIEFPEIILHAVRVLATKEGLVQ